MECVRNFDQTLRGIQRLMNQWCRMGIDKSKNVRLRGNQHLRRKQRGDRERDQRDKEGRNLSRKSGGQGEPGVLMAGRRDH